MTENTQASVSVIATIVKYLQIIIRYALMASIVALCISSLVNFTVGKSQMGGESVAFVVGWCTAMLSGATILYGTPALLLIAVYYKLQQVSVWAKLKKELKLLLFALVGIGLFVLSQYYWISNFLQPPAL